jgi:hypothetical protein
MKLLNSVGVSGDIQATNFRGNLVGGTVTATTGLFSSNVTAVQVQAQGSSSIILDPNRSAIGNIRFGSAISWATSGNLSIFPSMATVGIGFDLSYYTGSGFYYPALRIDNVASGYSNLLLMKDGGNVGIGSPTPSASMLVVGSSSWSGYRPFLTFDEVASNSGANSMGIDWRHGGLSGFPWGTTSRLEVSRQGTAAAFDMIFSTFGGTLTEKMRIMADGKVGINNSNPENKLDVKTSATEHIVLSGSFAGSNSESYGGMYWMSGKFTIQSWIHNTGYQPIIMNPSGGNVGIGTVTPSGGLQINNPGTWWSLNNIGTNLLITGSRNNAIGIFDYAGLNPVSLNNSSGMFGIHKMPPISDSTTAPGYLFTINVTSGNIGINYVSPTHALTINETFSGGTNAQIKLINPVNSTVNSYFGNWAENLYIQQGGYYKGGTGWVLDATTSAIASIGLQASTGGAGSSVVFGTTAISGTPTTRMIIDKNGFVGIGTTSPSGALHVVGAQNGPIRWSYGSAVGYLVSDNSGVGFGDSLTITNGIYSYSTSAQLWFQTNSTRKMTLDSAGNLGIGTTAPGWKLEVADTTNVPVALALSPYTASIGTNYNWRLIAGSSASTYRFDIQNGNAAGPYLSIINQAAASGIGFVGISCSTPKYLLDIGGGSVGGGVGSAIRAGFSLIGGHSGNDYDHIGYNFAPVASAGSTWNYERADSASMLQFNNGGFIFRGAAAGTAGATISPTIRMQIGGDGKIDLGSTWRFDTVSGIMTWGSAFANGTMSWDANGAYIYAQSGKKLGFGANGSSSNLVIDTTGNAVFSGSVTTSAFSVSGAGATRVTINSTSVSAWRGIDFAYNGAPYHAIDSQAQNGELRLSAGLSANWGGWMSFYQDAVEAMRIDTNGWVGIGQPVPKAPLHVKGQQYQPPVSGTTSGAIFRIEAGSNVCLDSGSVTGGNWAFWQQVTDVTNLAITSYPFCLQPNGGTVGIGTLTPGCRLDLGSNAGNLSCLVTDGQFRTVTNAQVAGYQIYYGASQYGYISGQTAGLVIDSVAAMPIILSTGASEKVRLTSSGNLLIGTPTDSSGSTRAIIRASAVALPAVSGTAQTAGLRIENASHNAVLDMGQGTITEGYGSWIQATDRAGLGNYYPLLLQPRGAAVLIGRTAAYRGGALVVQAGNVTPTSTTANFHIHTSTAQGIDVGGSMGLGGLTGTDESPFGYIAGRKENAISGNYAGYLAFSTQNAAGAVAERLRIDSTGNVLIGTSAAATAKLVVSAAGNGTSYINAINCINSYTNAGQFWVTLFDGVTGPATSGDSLISNNVGHMFVSPNAASKDLKLRGGLWSSNGGMDISSDGNIRLPINATYIMGKRTDTNYAAIAQINASNNLALGGTYVGAVTISTGVTTDAVIITSGGAVGIGANPSYLLHIFKTGATVQSVIQSDAAQNGQLDFHNSTAIQGGIYRPGATTNQIRLWTNSGGDLVNLNGTAIGLGTTATSNHKVNIVNGAAIGSDTYIASKLLFDNDMTLSSNRDVLITPSGSTAAFIVKQTTGRVGIGTTSPGYNLEVSGSFAATTKSFVIPHPTKKGKKLRYGSLEGPENGVYVRGRLKGTRMIMLPEYWEKLVDPESITVSLTPVGSAQQLYVRYIHDNIVHISNGNLLDKRVDCYYVVYGERCDVDKLETEIDA